MSSPTRSLNASSLSSGDAAQAAAATKDAGGCLWGEVWAEYRRQKEEERVVHLPEQWTRMDHCQYKHEQVAAEAHS